MEARDAARIAANAALDKKAEEIEIYDLRGISSVTDFFVICTGSTDVHCKAIQKHISNTLKDDKIRPFHIEGVESARWILLDYVDFVVHVFQPEVREYYNLESIWGDATSEKIDDEGVHEG